MAYSYNEKLLSKGNNSTCNNTDEFTKNVEQKKVDTKKAMLCDSIYINFKTDKNKMWQKSTE